MRILLAAIHGILTGQTDASWPDKLDAWFYLNDPDIKVLKKEYRAGPFPRWNCWIKDPILARSLANELELFLTDAGPRRPAIWFVAHSNGAVIALLAARHLIERGHEIGGLIFTGAACDADINGNGILEWQSRGMLGAAIAYSSNEDELLNGEPGIIPRASLLARLSSWLWSKAIWPYGCLGRTGWLFRKRPLASLPGSSIHPFPQRLITRWFSGGHSTYFAPENMSATFSRIHRDIAANGMDL